MPALTDNAEQILRKRYLIRNEEGIPQETPDGMFRRVAEKVASADAMYGRSESEVRDTADSFYDLMTSLSFLPNTPTLINAGKPRGQLSACFVLPIDDSMESIFDGVKYSAIIHKSGGGTGFSFSRLRPKGDVVGSTMGVSSGPVSFMKAYDAATETVKQGGARRGANMALLRVDHPDILDFITCKDDPTSLNNFNISVGLTEAFMNAVESDDEYALVNPRTGKTARLMKAKTVFEAIVRQSWKNGEPGIVFLDRMNTSNPTPALGAIESTNPCGEQPLLPFESCNLGSINLARMVRTGADGPEVDWERLASVTRQAVHFLDNVIDVNEYPLPIIEELTKANRKIGLGVMGWADLLVQLGIPYNSEEAISLADKVMEFIQAEGRRRSCELAEWRGVFPNHEKSVYRGVMPLRNATVTTIAPTGSLSIIAGCSSGIEPLFALSFNKSVLEGTTLNEVNPYFESEVRAVGFDGEMMSRVAETGSIAGFREFPEEVRRVFVTAHDISPADHIRMQAAFQKHVDNAVSKTVNFPRLATVDDVREVYLLAHRLGCKGVTVYRDGSRGKQVLSTKQGGSRQGDIPAYDEILGSIRKVELPTVMDATRVAVQTRDGTIYVNISKIGSNPCEVFITTPPNASPRERESYDIIARLFSLGLRCGIPVKDLLRQIEQANKNHGSVSSVSAAILRAFAYIGALGAAQGETCPECQGFLEMEGGCTICHCCGWTRC